MSRFILLLLILSSCGAAKTQVIDTKYDICLKACDLKYSKYDGQKLYQCKSKCQADKYDQN